MPCGAPMVRAALSDDGPILTTERLVPVAEVKLSKVAVVAPKLVTPLTNKLVEVALVDDTLVKKALVEVMEVTLKLVGEKLAAERIPLTYKLVVVAPIPRTDSPPITVVETLVPPSWIPPKEAPVPIKMVDEPIPVPMFTVLDVPIPRESV